MTAIVIAEAVVILLLGILVAGLLRSHAEILRKLHDLGVHLDGTDDETSFRVAPHVTEPGLTPTAAADIGGVTPAGDAIGVTVAGGGATTLVAFLSSGCLTCAGFWDALADPARLEALGGVRPVIVTKGPDDESPTTVGQLAPPDVPVIMDNRAWGDYGVPGSPYFVLVDGTSTTIRGEGSATDWEQLTRLMGEAVSDTELHRSRKAKADMERERRVDEELLAAGIPPGHPSLYRHPESDDEEAQ